MFSKLNLHIQIKNVPKKYLTASPFLISTQLSMEPQETEANGLHAPKLAEIDSKSENDL